MEDVRAAFEFTWKIKNFAYCTQQREEFLKCPLFSIDQTDWCLLLFPRGDCDRKYLSCYLQRSNNCRGPEEVQVSFIISIIKSADLEIDQEQKLNANFRKGDKHGYVKLQKRQDIFKDKAVFLVNDTLTIRCEVWKDFSNGLIPNSATALEVVKEFFCDYAGSGSFKYSLPDLMHTTIGNELIELKRKICPLPNKCLTETNIRVENRTFIWKIHKFSQLTKGTILSIQNFSASPNNPVFNFSTYLIGDSAEEEKMVIEVRIINQFRIAKIAMTCKVSLVDKETNDVDSVQNQHLFFLGKESSPWKFPFFLKNRIMDYKNKCLPNDILTLRLQLTVSDGLSTSHIEESHVLSSFEQYQSRCIHCPSSLKEDFRALYLGQISCDVSLRAESEIFSAHRIVLKSRSPVFSDLLENYNAGDVIEIEGITSKTLNKLLLFMYSDMLADIQIDSALELYSAAVQFQLHSLVEKCSNFLKSNIDVKNVCKVLALAHRYQNSCLAAYAEEYICKNTKQLLQSSAWKKILENVQILPKKISNTSRKRKCSVSIIESDTEEENTPSETS